MAAAAASAKTLSTLTSTESKLMPEERKHKNKKNNETNISFKTTTNNFTPITDLTSTSSSAERAHPPHTPTSTSTTSNSTTSRIPYPYPLTTLLNNNKINQFQRSASLRMRSIKSNLLFDCISGNEANMEQLNMKNNTRTDTTVRDEATKDQVRHDFLSTGRISPRRKVALTLQQNLAANRTTHGLTRSLSLRRNYNSSNKTETQKEATEAAESDAAVTESLKCLQLKENKHSYEFAEQRELPDGVAAEEQLANHVNGVTETENLDKMETKTANEHIQDLSLKKNVGKSVTTSTTTTHVRPATLATTGKAIKTSASVTSSPKTPNSKCPHLYCTKQPLTTVPETKLTPKTPPVTPDYSPCTYLDDDLDSMYSFATTTSGRSTMSCEHPYVARNGTTFSGRKMKYVVHCSNYAGQVGSDYLTPTQRQIRRLKAMRATLCALRQDLEQKDAEILRLTREVVELRLFKASLSSPEERSASSDAVTVREAELKTSQDVSPIVDMVDDGTKSSPRHIIGNQHHHQHHNHHHHQLSSEMQSSFADSGHFEDMTSLSVHSKDSSYATHMHDIACGSDEAAAEADNSASGGVDDYERQRQELIQMYEQRIEDLIRNQDATTSEMKRSHNDKVEALLQKLSECNTRYADIVPDFEHAKEHIRELEKQLDDLQRKLIEHEEKQNKMYLHMYQQGQEAEKIARADQALELAHRAPDNKISINELLHQLQSTQDELENIRAAECRNECGSNHALLTAKEAISLWVLGARKTIYRRLLEAQKTRTHVDPEVTLQFLKSAVYYFLTDKDNSHGHLQAIESILEFTEAEKLNIEKSRATK